MRNKFVLSIVLLLILGSVSVNAGYYYERTYSRTSDGNTFEKEIEFRGSFGGPSYSDDYDRYYDGRYRKCSNRDSRRNYYNRYLGRGYSTRCSGRYYYRGYYQPTSRTTNVYPDTTYNRREGTSTYTYRGRTITRTTRY